MKIRGMPVGRMVDAVAPAMLIGQMIGRIGCLINGDAYGAPTSLPWGIVYTHPDVFLPASWIGSVATHPTPVYEMIWDGIVLGIIWRQMGRMKPDGSLYLLYLAMYSFGRFFITFLRQDKPVIFDLQQAHILSIAIFVVATVWLLVLSAQAARVPAPVEATSSEQDSEDYALEEYVTGEEEEDEDSSLASAT